MQLKGHVHYNSDLDKFDLAFWVENAGVVVTAGLGTLNWQVYNMEGVAYSNPDATGAGVAPNGTGIYSPTEVAGPTFITSGTSYLLYVSTTVSAVPVNTFISFQITNI
jgi:hypothetical protein